MFIDKLILLTHLSQQELSQLVNKYLTGVLTWSGWSGHTWGCGRKPGI